MCDHCELLASVAPWHAVNLYSYTSKQIDLPDELPPYAAKLAAGTAEYEQKIRAAWEALKDNPTVAGAKAFAEMLAIISGELWPIVFAEVIGIDIEDLTSEQQELLEDSLSEHHNYIRNSLLPDIVRGVEQGIDLASMDYRTMFLYAGALWSFGNVATIMFDGLSLRDLGDLFLFAGPNDDATCTGERGCDQYANNVYTVAQILSDQIFPGKLRCLTNCRHIWLPIASPLTEQKEFGGNGAGLKHLPGRHDQQRHAGSRGGVGRETWQMTMAELNAKYPSAGAMVDGRVVRDYIPNQDSIDASIDNPTILSGVREVPMSEFDLTGKHYSVSGTRRIAELAEEIEKSGEISPLIIVLDAEAQPYILEGATRSEALYRLGAKSFPAQVVIDEGSLYDRTVQAIEGGEYVPSDVLAEYEDLSVSAKHLPGRHDQQRHAPHSTGRVWTGRTHPKTQKLTKLNTGELGEQVAMRALQDVFGAEFKTVNAGINNAPIDVVGDHLAVEVKTGLASNQPASQKWRLTIGQPGKAEAKALKQMTTEEKRVHNRRKMDAIMQRKQDLVKEFSQQLGHPVQPKTVGVILNPEGTKADVFVIDGFHETLRWHTHATDENYMGTYDVDAVMSKIKHQPGKHDQQRHAGKRAAANGKGQFKSWFSTEEADAWASKTYGEEWAEDLSSDEYDAVETYWDAYNTVNGQLRGKEDVNYNFTPKEQVDDAITNLDKVLAEKPAPESFTAYRQTSTKSIGKLEEGMEFKDLGYASTSLNKDWSTGNFDGHLFEVRIPKGTAGAYLQNVKHAPPENEFLLARGTSFKVTYKGSGTSEDPSVIEVVGQD